MTPAILDAAELAQLAARRPPMEDFGPGSPRPLLAIRLAGADGGLGDWLRALPCPVIGLGAGTAAVGAACDVLLADADGLGTIARNVERAPIAAMVLVQHLRASETLSPAETLTTESFAFATLQQGPEFNRWLRAHRPEPLPAAEPGPPVRIERDGERLRLTLDRPRARNAISVAMRDALCEALDLALADPGITRIDLGGAGACFSIGGDLADFGDAPDPATAYWIRSLRLPARRLAALGHRLHVHVQGAAIGAGVEMAAFAHRLTAAPDAWFQLPELRYGLIPGAGGTASLVKRIGRQRTAYMALSMRKLGGATAHSWGLVDAIV